VTLDNYGRAWKIVAGEISKNKLHCATVPDGPDRQWKGGRYERLEAQNRADLKAHYARLKETEPAEIGALPTREGEAWRPTVQFSVVGAARWLFKLFTQGSRRRLFINQMFFEQSCRAESAR